MESVQRDDYFLKTTVFKDLASALIWFKRLY
jgi:hypothetical protein